MAQSRSLLLRELTADDGNAFIQLARESRRLHAPWVSPPVSAEKFEQYLARVNPAFKLLVACRHEDGALVGVFNLSQIVHGKFRNAYLAYYVFARFARRGYMTEALGQLLLRYTFRTLKLHRIEANIQPGNKASICLVERCGFLREGYSPAYLKIGGRWRDHERWAIRADIWRPSRVKGRQSTARQG